LIELSNVSDPLIAGLDDGTRIWNSDHAERAGSAPRRVEIPGPAQISLHPRRQSLCWSAGAVSPLQRADPAVSWASVASGPCRWTGKHRRWRQWRSGPFREIAVKDPRSVVQQFQGVW